MELNLRRLPHRPGRRAPAQRLLANQALNAIVFLYKQVLATDLPEDHLGRFLFERSRRPARVPTVLSVEEVSLVLARGRTPSARPRRSPAPRRSTVTPGCYTAPLFCVRRTSRNTVSQQADQHAMARSAPGPAFALRGPICAGAHHDAGSCRDPFGIGTTESLGRGSGRRGTGTEVHQRPGVAAAGGRQVSRRTGGGGGH